ncbi:MAG: hypothetical protein U0172_09270 [Nitrospiraceae bacterium]
MRLRTMIVTGALLVIAPSAWAGAPNSGATQSPSRSADQEFDLQQGVELLSQLLATAKSYLLDHVDITGAIAPGEVEGDKTGRLHVKLFPKGRTESSEAVEAESSFESKNGELSFQFRFRPSEPRTALPPSVL